MERWVDNAYWQYFCRFEFFPREAPINASTMTRWQADRAWWARADAEGKRRGGARHRGGQAEIRRP